MNSQLEQIAKSYDRHFIERGKKDSLDYDNLPDYITGHPKYPMWKTEMEGEHVWDVLMNLTCRRRSLRIW